MEKSKSDVLKVLRLARARIVKGWTQNSEAKNSRGEDVRPGDKTAVKWCALGAMMDLGFSQRIRAKAIIHLGLACQDQASGIMNFNDDVAKKKSQVLAVFDKAIRLARAA